MKQTNEQGYSFEIDKDLTQWAHEDRHKGDYIEKGLPDNIIVLRITKEDQFFGCFIFNTKTQTSLSKEMGIEAIACQIDAMRFINNQE